MKQPMDEGQGIELFAVSCAALAKVLGMQALNMARQHRGEAMAYTDDDFFDAAEKIEKWGEEKHEAWFCPNCHISIGAGLPCGICGGESVEEKHEA